MKTQVQFVSRHHWNPSCPHPGYQIQGIHFPQNYSLEHHNLESEFPSGAPTKVQAQRKNTLSLHGN